MEFRRGGQVPPPDKKTLLQGPDGKGESATCAVHNNALSMFQRRILLAYAWRNDVRLVLHVASPFNRSNQVREDHSIEMSFQRNERVNETGTKVVKEG